MPSIIFIGTVLLLSYSAEHQNGTNTIMCLAVGCILAIMFAVRTFILWRAFGGPKAYVDSLTQPSRLAASPVEANWFFFLSWTCLMAVLAGVVLGNINYTDTMRPYQSMAAMSVA